VKKAVLLAGAFLAACGHKVPVGDGGMGNGGDGGAQILDGGDGGSTDGGDGGPQSPDGGDGGLTDGGDGGLQSPDGGDGGLTDGGDGGGQVADAGDGGLTFLATGTWSNVQYAASCPGSYGAPIGQTISGNPNPGFGCATLTISCPGLADLRVAVALAAQPPSVNSRGVLMTHGGGGGTHFYANNLVQAWFTYGFNLAQVAWSSDWECPLGPSDGGCAVDTTPPASRPGMKNAACRPATVFKWIHDQAQLPDGGSFQPSGLPYCGVGFSGGSGALWYALLHYGLGSELDYALISASTPFARIDIGCDPSYAGQTVAATCSNVASPPQVPQQYNVPTNGPTRFINGWSSTTTCNDAPSTDELAYWKRNSIVSDDAIYDIPTQVVTYDCVDVVGGTVNLVPGMNTYLYVPLRGVDPSAARFKALCVVNGTNGSCGGESVFADPTMAAAAQADLEQNCKLLAR
jgi:hypothetical protein